MISHLDNHMKFVSRLGYIPICLKISKLILLATSGGDGLLVCFNTSQSNIPNLRFSATSTPSIATPSIVTPSVVTPSIVTPRKGPGIASSTSAANLEGRQVNSYCGIRWNQFHRFCSGGWIWNFWYVLCFIDFR